MSELTQMMCVPCRGGEPPLDVREISELGRETPGWNVIEVEGIKRLERVFKFKNFVEALDFTRRIGELAESQGPSGAAHGIRQGHGHLVDPQDSRAAQERLHHERADDRSVRQPARRLIV